jgi:hypothetical protein
LSYSKISDEECNAAGTTYWEVWKVVWIQGVELVAPQRVRNCLSSNGAINNNVWRSPNAGREHALSSWWNRSPVPVWYAKVCSSGSVLVSSGASGVELGNLLNQIVEYLLKELNISKQTTEHSMAARTS